MIDHADRCWRCGRQISEPLSVYVGMGPVCRAAYGIVESRGWRAVEQLSWWREDVSGFAALVRNLDRALMWWRGRILLLDQESLSHFDVAFTVVDRLMVTSPEDGKRVMGLVWRLVAEIRFTLEPTLRVLRDAGVTQALWVEGVRELAEVMPSIEGILCGLRAPEDAVDLATIRAQDRAKLQSGSAVEPIEGVE